MMSRVGPETGNQSLSQPKEPQSSVLHLACVHGSPGDLVTGTFWVSGCGVVTGVVAQDPHFEA